MKTIGLIGGMSWESTAVYYRLINEAVRRQRGGLHSAEIAMRSLDFVSVVELQKAGRWDEAGKLLGEAGAGLARSGAACVLICTNTMHLVADPVAAMSGVPLIDIIDETARALRADVPGPCALGHLWRSLHGQLPPLRRRPAPVHAQWPDRRL